jgi:hypothetical protein
VATPAVSERRRVLQEIADLPALFPLLQPDSDAFERWAAGVAPVRRPREELIDEGLALLDEEELDRITRAYADEFPREWGRLCEQAGSEALAEEAVLAGSVAVALRVPRQLDPDCLGLLEESAELRADAAETLALVLDPADLWSVLDAFAADRALAAIPPQSMDAERRFAVARAEAKRRWTLLRERRLSRLVRRVERQLPLGAFGRASEALSRACEAFDGDAELRLTVAALLLADAPRPLEDVEISAAA